MQKKYFYLIIGLIVILSIGALLAAYAIFYGGNRAGQSGTQNPFLNLFPFGQPTTQVTSTTQGTGGVPTETLANIPSITNPLRQISKTPTAGYTIVIRNGQDFIDYVERPSGNIFEINPADMTVVRLSNALIPGIREAFFGNTGKTALLRYADNSSDIIRTYSLNLANPTKPNNSVIVDASSTPNIKPNGSFLSNDIASVIVSTDTNRSFFITSTADFATRRTIGVLYDMRTGSYSTVFRSQFSEWLPVSFSGDTVFLQTKASQMVPGYLYSLNVKSGAFRRVLGGINGLTALSSPDGKYILYSESVLGGLKTSIYVVSTGNSITLNNPTLPEKCVWKNDSSSFYCASPSTVPNGQFPDSWYMGITSFNDAVWNIDPKTGNATSVFVPENRANQSMDIENPRISSDGRYLVFTNKKDSTPWLYDLNGTY